MNLTTIVEILADAAAHGNVAIFIAPLEEVEIEEESNPYEDFWELPGETINGGTDQDAILMDNPLQS